jgi:hypothetical protein
MDDERTGTADDAQAAAGGADGVDLRAGLDPADGAEDAEGPFAPSYDDYAAEELLEQAQGNAQAAIIATVAFLRERGLPVADWSAALGARFARAWGEPEPWGADEFLDAMLTNFRSLGADVVVAEFDPERSTAAITGFPDPEQCALFGVAPADAAQFLDATQAIAAERGLAWAWELAGEETRFVASRRDR